MPVKIQTFINLFAVGHRAFGTVREQLAVSHFVLKFTKYEYRWAKHDWSPLADV